MTTLLKASDQPKPFVHRETLLGCVSMTSNVPCQQADFHAHRGDFVVQALVIDTQTVLITGNGHVNMHLERIKLDLHGRPKKFALFRLRTPIKIGGTLLHHGIVDYKWIAVALVLGTIIGIPLGLANFKIIPVSLVPLGKEIVPVGQPHEARSLPLYH